MYYTKQTQQEKRVRLKRLNFLKNKCEVEIKKWDSFLKMSYREKENCRDLWDKYYEDVRKTPVYEIFMAQREALKNGQVELVKELAQSIRDMKEKDELPSILQPKQPNPYEYEKDSTVRAYHQVKKAIEELQLETETDNDIFS